MNKEKLQILLDYFAAENIERLHKRVYKETACGAWVTVDDRGVTFGSIVEGSDVETPREFIKWENVSIETISSAIQEVENNADIMWQDANEEEGDYNE